MFYRVRKEKKIKPGYTPPEDVSRFRGTRQAQMDSTALPKGQILGWLPPSSSQSGDASSTSAKKKKRKPAKKAAGGPSLEDRIKASWGPEEKIKPSRQPQEIPKESWEDSDEEESNKTRAAETNEPDDVETLSIIEPSEARVAETKDGSTISEGVVGAEDVIDGKQRSEVVKGEDVEEDAVKDAKEGEMDKLEKDLETKLKVQ